MIYSGSNPESQTVNVSNGVLNLNTVPLASNAYAYFYQDTYSSSTNAFFQITLDVTDVINNSISMLFGFYDSTSSDLVSVTSTGWASGSTSGTFSNPGAFQTFTIQTNAAANTYTLTLNGVVVAAGQRNVGYAGGPQVYFGDGTPTGGNCTAEIQSVYYDETPPSPVSGVPQPSSLAMLISALLASFLVLKLKGRQLQSLRFS